MVPQATRSRRQILGAVLGGLGAAAPGLLRAETKGQPRLSLPDRATKERWLALAEGAKPRLAHRLRSPVRLVQPIRDESAFQGWRMQDTGALEALAGRTLRAGDRFVLDFGEHVVGYLRFQARAVGQMDAPCRLRLTFAEVPAEAAEPFDPYSGGLSRAWLQDDEITIDVLPGAINTARRYAFRFVKVEVVATSRRFGVALDDFACDTVTSASTPAPPLPAETAPELRRLDEVSLRTLRNCMQTVFEDGPKRDRRLWLGDLRLQALTSYLSHRNDALVKRCLYLFAALGHDDGISAACVFEQPRPSTSNDRIMDYAALFGAVLDDYLSATSDTRTAQDLYPVARNQLLALLPYTAAGDLFVDPKSWWIFIDWRKGLDKQAAMHGVLVYALRRTARLADRVGERRDAAFFRERASALAAAARRTLYDPKLRLFVSGPSRQVSWASQAWMVLAGVIEGEAASTALAGARAHAAAVKPGSPYLYHHVVDALFCAGCDAEAHRLLADYWGAMIDRGATTFFEVFDPGDPLLSPYRSALVNSYCHAWSCTPAYFIRRGQKVGRLSFLKGGTLE